MTEAEKRETLARIEAAEKELAELKAKVQSNDEVSGDEVPDVLEWDAAEKCWRVLSDGKVDWYLVCDVGNAIIERRRLFKTEKYAQMYREKTQFIADLLHFKWLYDRDYEPDWTDDRGRKYFVAYYHDIKKWVFCYAIQGDAGGVYFSSQAIAQKCADWLNRKEGCK